jgi:hypothetical protein
MGLAVLLLLAAMPGWAQAPTSSPEFQRKARALQLIWSDLEKQPEGSGERRKFQDEFLTESEGFLKRYPDHAGTWALRGLIAVELKLPKVGREAGQKLKALGQENSDKPLFQELFAQLERNKWLGDKSPAAGPSKLPTVKTHKNSLGMHFAAVPGTEVLFSMWETRVQDYEAYARAAGDVDSSWREVYFEQEPNHPVVNVSWEDAQAFATWLTEKERREGRLTWQQRYRLPTDLEWSRAVGLASETRATPKARDYDGVAGVYPWGTQWPPPRGAGNYDWFHNADTFAETSPVGSFTANQFGLFDLGGNVLEWCEDYYDGTSGSHVQRGGAFLSYLQSQLLSSCRDNASAGDRSGLSGFRLVLVGVSVR